MAIYFVLLVLGFLAFRFLRKKTALRVVFIAFALVAALRAWTVGVDTEQFYGMYATVGKSDWSFAGIRYEYLYCVVVKILYSISKDPQLLLVATSIFVNFAYYRFIKKNTSNYALASFLYMFMNIFFSNMNMMREAIAVSIVLLSFGLLRKHHYIVFLGFSALAFFFHKTAIVAFMLAALYWVAQYRHSKKLLIIGGVALFLGATALFSIAASFLGGTYSEYGESEFGAGNNIGAILEFGVYLVLFLVIVFGFGLGGRRSGALGWERGEVARFYQCLSIVILIALALVIRMNIFNRLASFLTPFAIIIVSESALRLKFWRAPNHRLVLRASCVALFAYWLTIALFRPEWAGCSDYAFFWQVAPLIP